MEWSIAANRYLTWLTERNSLTEQDIAAVRSRAEALAVDRLATYVTSKDLGEVWREIGRRRAAAGKQRTK